MAFRVPPPDNHRERPFYCGFRSPQSYPDNKAEGLIKKPRAE